MNNRTRTQYAILNITTSVVGFLFNTVLGFITRILFVKYLTADYLGLHALFYNIVTMLSLTELGVGGAITYSLYEPISKNNQKKIAALYYFFSKAYKIIGFIVLVFGLILIPFLDSIIKDPPNVKENVIFLYLIFLLGSSFSYFFSHKIAIIRASQQDYIVVGLSYLTGIFQNLVQIILLIKTKNYLYYLYAQFAFGILYLLIISIISDKKFKYLKIHKDSILAKSEKNQIFKNIWALSISKFSGLLVNNTDNIIISYLFNIVSVGMLSNYVLLTKTIQNLVGNSLLSISSGIGNFFTLEGKSKTKQLFMNIQFLMFTIYGWISINILLLINDVVKLLFGENYVMDINIPLILAINFYMVGLQSVLWIFRSSLGLFNYKKYLLLITAFINLILSFYLGSLLGVLGVLLATAIARLLTNWWYDPIVVFKYGFGDNLSDYYKYYFKYLIFIILISLASFYTANLFHFTLVYGIIIKALLLTFLFFVSLHIVFHKQIEYNYFKKKIYQLLLKIKK